MKTILGIVAIASTAIGMAGCGSSSSQSSSGASTPAADSSAPAQVAQVTASNFKWTLDKTTFKAGAPIEFDVKGAEGAHGFAIDGTKVSQMVTSGSTAKVTWTPPKPGTYTIRCNLMCGSGHSEMSTTFTVQ